MSANPETNTEQQSVHANENTNPTMAKKRSKRMWIAISLFATAGIAWITHWLITGRYHESTDNAYVTGDLVTVNSQTQGTVESIEVDENQQVQAGQVLARINATDAQTTLNQARAQLEQTARQLQGTFNNVGIAHAQVAQAETAVKLAQDAVARRAPLVKTGAVSQDEFSQVQDQLIRAQATHASAIEQYRTARAQIDGVNLLNHPNMQAAKTAFRNAYINFKRLEVRAPTSGFIGKRFVQIGQPIAPNTPLMTIIAASELRVEANLKETQLENIRVGQPVKLYADTYGGKVTYKGTVSGIGLGTGSAFSVLPAQNATGNWIKIVQRVPVRIALDPSELNQHPLRVGMSMNVSIDTHQRGGAVLGTQTTSSSPYVQTQVYQQDDAEAEQEAENIIRSQVKQP